MIVYAWLTRGAAASAVASKYIKTQHGMLCVFLRVPVPFSQYLPKHHGMLAVFLRVPMVFSKDVSEKHGMLVSSRYMETRAGNPENESRVGNTPEYDSRVRILTTNPEYDS